MNKTIKITIIALAIGVWANFVIALVKPANADSSNRDVLYAILYAICNSKIADRGSCPNNGSSLSSPYHVWP